MYAKRVNRGLTFPKPGIYGTGLILIVGLLAISTGINGLYLFLAFGLATLVVSGLLSERMIRAISIPLQHDAVVDPDGGTLQLELANLAEAGYRIEVYLQAIAKTSGLLTKRPENLAAGQILAIQQHERQSIKMRLEGPLARGIHSGCWLYIRTGFPFGLLDKFKILPLPLAIIVPPKSVEWESKSSAEEQPASRATLANDEFLGHQRFLLGDAARFLDHRRNVFRREDDWLLKKYGNPEIAPQGMLDFSRLLQAQGELEYEALLSALYTLAGRLVHVRRERLFVKGQLGYELGPGNLAKFFAGFPRYEQRAEMDDYLIRGA